MHHFHSMMHPLPYICLVMKTKEANLTIKSFSTIRAELMIVWVQWMKVENKVLKQQEAHIRAGSELVKMR